MSEVQLPPPWTGTPSYCPKDYGTLTTGPRGTTSSLGHMAVWSAPVSPRPDGTSSTPGPGRISFPGKVWVPSVSTYRGPEVPGSLPHVGWGVS